MSSRRSIRFVLTGLLSMLFIATQTMTSFAQADTVREASLNWADYGGATAVVTVPEQSWAGDAVREASLNWADYGGAAAAVTVPDQLWAGDAVRKASLNWADYGNAPDVVHASD